MADDLTYLNKTQLSRYHNRVDAKMKTKVDRTVKDDQNATNTIDNQKAQEGCVMSTAFPSSDTTGTVVSFNTASENGPNGILAQVYAKNTTGPDAGKGMRMNFTKTGAYYGVGASTPTDAAHELAVKGDIEGKYIKDLGKEAVSGGPYNLPYYFYTEKDADKITAHAKTISLDGDKTLGDYSLDVPAMDGTNAGLYTKALADAKSKVEWTPVVTTGTKIAEIEIDNTKTEIFAPNGGSGTLTGIKMNGSAVTVTGGIADLGTVITAHQDISGKLNKLPEEPFSHTEYKFPFHIEDPVQNQSNITAKFHTLVLNDGTTRNQYTITLPSADVAGNKAGLYTKELADAKFNANLGTGYANKILGTDSTGKVVVSTTEVTQATLDKVNLLSDVDSSKGTIQAQIDSKLTKPSGARYIGKWNAVSGLITTKITTPFTYSTGDYLEVQTTGTTNYKPKPTTYDGAASTITETGTISTSDIYYWTGTEWEIRAATTISLLFKDIGGAANENLELRRIIESVPSIKLNGATTVLDSTTTASIYAPTNAGASGKIVGWDDTNKVPTWKNGAETYRFSGSVSDKSKLPTSPEVGDVYYIVDKGTNYAYDGTSPEAGEVPEKWADIGSIWGLENLVYRYTRDPNKVMVTDSTNGDIIPSTITTAELKVVKDLTGYAKASSSAAIAATDTILTAFGKLEYKVDNPQRIIKTETATIFGGNDKWTADGAFFKQDITISDMTADEKPIISALYNGTTKEAVEAQQTAASKMIKAITSAGKITVYAREKTTTDLPILIKRV